jgi:hypothetical protein
VPASAPKKKPFRRATGAISWGSRVAVEFAFEFAVVFEFVAAGSVSSNWAADDAGLNLPLPLPDF